MRPRAPASLLAAVCALAGCDGTDAPAPVDPPPGCDAFVQPGPDAHREIQRALLTVEGELVVCLSAGDFELELPIVLDRTGARLYGAGAAETTLDWSAQASGDSSLLVHGVDVQITDLTLVASRHSGIRIEDSEDVVVRGVTITSRSAPGQSLNGIHGFRSVNVIIDDCIASGHDEVGFHFLESSDVVVSASEAFGNPVGVGYESTGDSVVRDTHLHDNSSGVVIVNFPRASEIYGGRVNVYGNVVEDNDRPNDYPPPGNGVVLLAGDDNEVHDNDIRGNDSVGVAILAGLDPFIMDPVEGAAYDMFAQGNHVHDNRFTDNGSDPAALVTTLIGGVTEGPDIFFGGCVDPSRPDPDGALRNCIVEDASARFLHRDLCAAMPTSSTDPSPHACSHPPLPVD